MYLSFTQFLMEEFEEFDEPTDRMSRSEVLIVYEDRIADALKAYNNIQSKVRVRTRIVRWGLELDAGSSDTIEPNTIDVANGTCTMIMIISPAIQQYGWRANSTNVKVTIDNKVRWKSIECTFDTSNHETTSWLEWAIKRLNRLAILIKDTHAVYMYVKRRESAERLQRSRLAADTARKSLDSVEPETIITDPQPARIPVPSFDNTSRSIQNPTHITMYEIENSYGYDLSRHHPRELEAAMKQVEQYYGTIAGSRFHQLAKTCTNTPTRMMNTLFRAIENINQLQPVDTVRYVRYTYYPPISVKGVLFRDAYLSWVISNKADTIIISDTTINMKQRHYNSWRVRSIAKTVANDTPAAKFDAEVKQW